jgi:acetylornithine deacetylase/succinyl-diaminopimelate desuccinylase-like protein
VDAVLEAVEKRREHSIDTLREFLRIPSVSADPDRKGDVRRAADHLAGILRAEGVDHVEVVPTSGHAIVIAEKIVDPSAPTVLVYGHYDVQPIPDPSVWTSPPFDPVIRDGKIWARGATDDKGQLMVHVMAAGAYLSTTGELPVNLKFVLEGEEEVGSANLATFVTEHRKRLACDVVVISDTAMAEPGVPSICTGLRGIAYAELTIRAAKQDLHSGGFGGAVDNPALVLGRVLGALKDPRTGRILIDSFYDDVREVPAEERRGWSRLPDQEKRYKEMTGVPRLFGEEGYSVVERLWARPSLDVNGIWGGFTGTGSMTVLPARASAKVSMRLVPDQNPERAFAMLRRQVEKLLPPTVLLEKFTDMHGAVPWTATSDSPALGAAFRAIQAGFGAEAIATREGGSIPIVPMLQDTLEAPVVLLGFGLHDEGAHGPDEHFDLGNFHAGVRTSAHYLREVRAAVHPRAAVR